MSRLSMERRRFLKTMGFGAAALAAAPGFAAETSRNDKVANRPNVLFIFTDDQRAGTIQALGNDDVTTPNMDWLVRNGTTFTNGYIMGGTCPAVCTPSRVMVKTGRSLFRIERESKWAYPVSKKYPTLAEVFRDAGYNTFATGKQNKYDEDTFVRGYKYGETLFFGGMYNHYRVPFVDLKPDGSFVDTPKPEGVAADDERDPELHSSNQICDAAVEFLDNHANDKPFMMYVSTMAPHDPRIMPKKYLDMYEPEELPLPKNFLPEHPFDNGELNIRDENLAGHPRTKEEIRKHLAAYYAMITHLDAQLGRVLEALRESGQMDNTIIVFAGDNGLAVGQHGLMGKQNVYEHSVGVPLIFSGPGIPKNETRDAFAYLFDIFPTLCDLTNLETPDTVDGKSLAPVIENPDREVRDTMYYGYRDFQRAVRKGDFKLIEYAVKGKRTTQLFHLKKDPWEMNNLADDPDYKDKLEEMRRLLVQCRDRYDDTTSEGADFWQTWENEK